MKMEYTNQTIKKSILSPTQVICLILRHRPFGEDLKVFRSWMTRESLVLNVKIKTRYVFLLMRRSDPDNIPAISLADPTDEQTALCTLMPTDTTIQQTSLAEFCEFIAIWMEDCADRVHRSFWKALVTILGRQVIAQT